ncbi:SIR2 family protein [Brevibacillus sp. HB2.2]|uniref:SIR2 family protein n=1 Tax=Brevibacillus sp. HB2.2 TaxID=2738846 RepID=UPI00156B64E9|nr:SIR2 family protein [Brevibacillus sp. HB2.2]NRS46428.1 SIR2 family protein [Brevibacillus sp. HB2.2]
MEKLNQYIKDITNASENGKLVFFVGAGLSTLSEYPQWWELVEKYHIGLYGKPKDSNYSSDEYLRIPQIFYDVKGEDEFDRILKDVFSVEKPTNPIHDKILTMNPVHIITTNYDSLIDKTCSKRGRYFSVISAEEDVASATSPRYLLKVHGDFRRGFKGKHVVLKESDYVNYEQEYPLISNIMKTIMATHTIVFIGYGLGDYNINLLLNWVKKLQKDGYKRPFFISTAPEPIEHNTAVYYESKGLRIIDAARLVESDGKDYMKRYNAVMDLLIDSRENNHLSEDDKIIEYIHEKLSPLFVLPCVRKIDLKFVFEYDYHFEVNGKVVPNKNRGFPYMERFFELHEGDISNISEESKQRFEDISEFFKRNGILCMIKSVGKRTKTPSFEIVSPAYNSNYGEMEKYIDTSSSNLEDDYRNAFFLACLGRWEEAYILYSDLLLRSIDESNWWIHYLSQINRYRLYQSITQVVRNLNGIGILVFGKQHKPFSDEFLTLIDREMKRFDINDVFDGMPYEFQSKYQILEFLSDNEYLYDDTVKLFELTNKVHSEMNKGSYSFGLTSENEVQYRLNENVRFLYENHLWLVSFKEFKQYVRNSLMLLFEKAEYEQTREVDEFGRAFGAGSSGFCLDYYDFVNVVKSFSIEDIKHIERSCKLERIEFIDIGEIESYLMRVVDEIAKCFSKGEMNIVFYTQFISEAKVALYFARYVNLSTEGLNRILKALLFHIPERDFDIGKRYLWVEGLTLRGGLPNSAITIIEEFLINQADRHKDSEFSEQSTNFSSRDFGNLIYHFEKSYVSNDLSEYALSLSEDMKNQVNFMFRLSPILSIDAKQHLLRLKRIEDIDGLIDSVQIGAVEVERISEFQDLIIEYMEKRKLNILADIENGVTSFYSEDYFVMFGSLYFLGYLTGINMENYLGLYDEYDFFVDPMSFNFTKFRLKWLKDYSEEVLERIAENESIRIPIVKMLKERIKDTNDKEYLEIFMKYFV